ncbi:Hypothetical protein A7982_02772 [Minicystis rosea]|nr:Hypothetical protein A7982_02772 [Minicystis rosea]
MCPSIPATRRSVLLGTPAEPASCSASEASAKRENGRRRAFQRRRPAAPQLARTSEGRLERDRRTCR